MKTSIKQNTSILYDQDYQLWLEATIQQLRSGEFTHVDWVNLLDELESMEKKTKEQSKVS